MHDLEHDQVPDARAAGEQQDGQQPLPRAAYEVGPDHHQAARQPVRHHPAEQHERHQRQDAGGEYEAQVPGVADVQHGEGQCDGRHEVAQYGGEAAEEEQAEVPYPQDVELVHPVLTR